MSCGAQRSIAVGFRVVIAPANERVTNKSEVSEGIFDLSIIKKKTKKNLAWPLSELYKLPT